MPYIQHQAAERQARDLLSRGIRRVVEMVEHTIGPRGQVVLLENPVGDPFGVTPPEILRNGYILLEEAELGNVQERVGIHLLQQLGREVWATHRDGVKTLVLTAGHFVTRLIEQEEAWNPLELRATLQEAFLVLKKAMEVQRKMPEELEGIGKALVPRGMEAEVFVEALREAGSAQRIQMVREVGARRGYDLKVQYGINWKFASLDRWLKARRGPYAVALFSEPLETPSLLRPFMERALAQGVGLLIIAPCYGERVREMLHVNRQMLPLAAYLAPQEKNWRWTRLSDLALYLQAPVFHPEGMDYNKLMPVLNVEPLEEGVRFLAPPSEDVKKLRERLEAELAHASGFARERLLERLEVLYPQVSLHITAPTPVLLTLQEQQARNILQHMELLGQGGGVPGGGIALFKAAQALPQGPITNLLREALSRPARAILRNAGLNPAEVLEEIPEGQAFDVLRKTWTSNLLDPFTLVMDIVEKTCSFGFTLARVAHLIVYEALEYESPFDTTGPIKEAGIRI